ncbi:MAG: NADH-quinone oxidoreductase subunit NuoK [Planctomycetota bacterium]|nr:NADH-quinone oxidoreductase subunit NuoK [Planctomycetota bacterium]
MIEPFKMAAAAAGTSAETLVLLTSAILFSIGTLGLLLRRNPMAILMSVELLLNSANLVLVLAARKHGYVDAQSAALIVLVLGAAEAVIGLALALALFRNRASTDIDEPNEVQG